MYKILHIDDNSFDLQLVEMSLRKRAPHLELVQSNDGEQGLRLVEDLEPHCMLCDYQMPGKSGLEVLKDIRSSGNTIPFVFLTGQGNERLAIDALRAGADDYFTKEEGFAHYERLVNSITRLADIYKQKKVHQEAQQKLALSEERFRLVSRATTDLIFEWEPEEDDLRWYGDVYSLLGYTPEQLGTSAEEYIQYIHPDDMDTVVTVIQAGSKRTKPFSVEYRIRTSAGSWRHFDVRALPVVNNTGSPERWVGAVTDITEQKENQQWLTFQSYLLDNIHDAIIATDLEGNITYVNNTECKILGYSRDQLIGSHVSMLGEDPESGATQDEIIRQTNAYGTWSGTIVNKTASGQRVTFACRIRTLEDAEGTPTGLVGISTLVEE